MNAKNQMITWGRILRIFLLGTVVAAVAAGLVLLLGRNVPSVSAVYTGPRRTVMITQWKRLKCEWTAIMPPYTSCYLRLYYPMDSSCPAGDVVRGYFTQQQCNFTCDTPACTIEGPVSTVEECSQGDEACTEVQTEVTYPPATINGSVSCTTRNGWCVSPAVVQLNGREPLANYSITALEGTNNGVDWSCPGASCNWSLEEGPNTFESWAVSSFGDTSLKYQVSVGVDTRPPQTQIEVRGMEGNAGWYVSAGVTVEGMAVEPQPGSGLEECTMSVDGTSGACRSETLADGVHTVVVEASDAAGNQGGPQEQVVKVDSTPPVLNLVPSAASFCPSCGQTLAISLSAQDTTSGVESWVLLAGGAQIAGGNGQTETVVEWNGAGASGGVVPLELRATDQAGNSNTVTVPVEVLVPTPTPTPSPTLSPTPGPTEVQTPTPAATDTPAPAPAATDTPMPGLGTPKPPVPVSTLMPTPALSPTPTPTPTTTWTRTPEAAHVCDAPYRIRVYVYVDTNRDNAMSPDEMVQWMQVYLLDRTYAMVDNGYTRSWGVSFCMGYPYYGQRVYIYVPYLLLIRTVDIPESPQRDEEVYVAVPAPVLPIYLP